MSDDALRPGARVGRYRLLERVGAGGMAEVFAARTEGAEGFARIVAIKVVHADASDEENLLALIDEARIASSLRHPNIVQVHELDRHGDGLYMVMEFLDGWPLDKLLKMASSKGARASLDVVLDLGGQLLGALSYAHHAPADDGTALELVHRDIKPSNLMLDALGHLKVVDFGIARASNIERRTATGVGKGTPAYMSPEQLYGQPVDPRSDLFAAGCVLFELATGARLFDASAFGPLILRRTEGFTESDRDRLVRACPELSDIISRAVAQDIEARWPDAASMGAALAAVGSGPHREATRQWLADVLGGDPSTLRRTVSDLAPEPRSTSVEATAPMPALDTEAGPTRLMPAPARRSLAPFVVGGALLLLIGLAVLVGRGPTTLPGAVDGPAVTIVAPDPSPEPTPEPAPEPAPETTPAEPVAAVEPTPRPVPTPAPTTESTPEPTPPPAVANKARGTLHVTLMPSGFAEVADVGRWATPGRQLVAPGVHEVRLLDKEYAVLGTARVTIRSGETSACRWDLKGGSLALTPSPFGDPCPVAP